MTCDDVYFDDEYLSMVPERRVETLYPNADGATLGLTPSTGTDHFALIDEAQMDASDYLAGSTVGQMDEFQLTDLSNIPRSIDGVKVVGYARKRRCGPCLELRASHGQQCRCARTRPLHQCLDCSEVQLRLTNPETGIGHLLR